MYFLSEKSLDKSGDARREGHANERDAKRCASDYIGFGKAFLENDAGKEHAEKEYAGIVKGKENGGVYHAECEDHKIDGGGDDNGGCNEKGAGAAALLHREKCVAFLANQEKEKREECRAEIGENEDFLTLGGGGHSLGCGQALMDIKDGSVNTVSDGERKAGEKECFFVDIAFAALSADEIYGNENTDDCEDLDPVCLGISEEEGNCGRNDDAACNHEYNGDGIGTGCGCLQHGGVVKHQNKCVDNAQNDRRRCRFKTEETECKGNQCQGESADNGEDGGGEVLTSRIGGRIKACQNRLCGTDNDHQGDQKIVFHESSFRGSN